MVDNNLEKSRRTTAVSVIDSHYKYYQKSTTAAVACNADSAIVNPAVHRCVCVPCTLHTAHNTAHTLAYILHSVSVQCARCTVHTVVQCLVHILKGDRPHPRRSERLGGKQER